MSEPEKQEAVQGQEFKETNDDRTHHLVLQLPGIERNHIRVVVRDSVLSFSAAIPNVRVQRQPPPPPPTTTTTPTTATHTFLYSLWNHDQGLEHLGQSHDGFRLVGNSTLVTGPVHLDFALPKGSVQEVDDMAFVPGASDYRGLLTVSIPTHKAEGFIPDDLEEQQEKKKRMMTERK